MEYKESIMEILKKKIEPTWAEEQERRKALRIPQRSIEEELECLFNQRVNCGGYALEIDTCIFPTTKGNFEQIISGLLEKLKFIRLLGDSELGNDEYIVLYRVSKKGGHHFVKVKDGHATEKNGCDKIQEFSGWPSELRTAPQAVFAVKKEHDLRLGDNEGTIFIGTILGSDFEESITQTILSGKTTFSYHNHEYCFEKNHEQPGIGLVCSQGRVIAEIMFDGKQCVVDIRDEEKGYVSNTSSKNKQLDCLECCDVPLRIIKIIILIVLSIKRKNYNALKTRKSNNLRIVAFCCVYIYFN